MLKRATQSVIEDETFHSPVEPAATALRTAKCVLDWSSNHKEAMVSFEHRICSALRPCFNGAQIAMTSRKEAMWRAYLKVRTSQEFRLLWKDISAEMKVPHIPAFYQAVTDHIFKEMFVAITPVQERLLQPIQPLSYEDVNVIRFAAGYVCRKVYTKVNNSRHPNKEELLSCIMELVERGDVEPSSSTDWVREVDRGGLWHVNESTYMLFCAMEEEFRHHFRLSNMSQLVDGLRDEVVASITCNEDVAFHCSPPQ